MGIFKEIPLTRGMVALVDDQDYSALSQYNWSADASGHTFYAKRTSYRPHKHSVRMHRQILGVTGNIRVDHINGNGLDNRRCNIRIASHLENMRNQRRKSVGMSSRFKGVSWEPDRRRWKAYIKIPGKVLNLGRYRTQEEAVIAYAKASIKHFGRFAAPIVEASIH